MAAQIKGIAFRTFLSVFESRFGREKRDELVEACAPTELHEALKYGKIVAASWYPLRWYGALHVAAQAVTGRGPQLARELSRAAVDHDLRGVYRVFVSLLSPAWILSKGPRFYSQYYDTGKMEIIHVERGEGAARFVGCVDFDANVWRDMLGGIEAVMTACGARDLRIEIVSGGGDGDTACEIAARWK